MLVSEKRRSRFRFVFTKKMSNQYLGNYKNGGEGSLYAFEQERKKDEILGQREPLLCSFKYCKRCIPATSNLAFLVKIYTRNIHLSIPCT